MLVFEAGNLSAQGLRPPLTEGDWEAGAPELWTADRDFNRFPGLPICNPLVGK